MALYRLSKKNYDSSPELFLIKLQERFAPFTYNVSSTRDIKFNEKDNYGRNIVKIKPYCKLHKGIKAEKYIRIDTLLNNNTKKPDFCPECLSERQRENSWKKPDQIKLDIKNSDDSFIRRHYTLVKATKKIDESGNQICILRCGQHEVNFAQSIPFVGKHRGCSECRAEYRKTNIKKDELLIQSVKDKLGEASDNFLINSFQRRSYKNKYTKIWVNLTCTSEKHVGNHNFWYYKEMINPNVCSLCREDKDSIGESILFDILLDQNEIPEQKKMLNDCIHIQPLQADFYLMINQQNLIIEFDGEQHFKASEKWGGKEGLLDRIKRDITKNKYAHKNNIHMLRIHYKQLKDLAELTTIIKETIEFVKAGNTELIELNPDPKFRSIYTETYAMIPKPK